jgi:hypothetical protein
MKSLITILLACCSLFAVLESKADTRLERALFASLLFDQDPETSRLGTVSIGSAYKKDEELTDILAEALILGIKKTKIGIISTHSSIE